MNTRTPAGSPTLGPSSCTRKGSHPSSDRLKLLCCGSGLLLLHATLTTPEADELNELDFTSSVSCCRQKLNSGGEKLYLEGHPETRFAVLPWLHAVIPSMVSSEQEDYKDRSAHGVSVPLARAHMHTQENTKPRFKDEGPAQQVINAMLETAPESMARSIEMGSQTLGKVLGRELPRSSLVVTSVSPATFNYCCFICVQDGGALISSSSSCCCSCSCQRQDRVVVPLTIYFDFGKSCDRLLSRE